MRRIAATRLHVLLLTAALAPASLLAASFPGNARVEVADPTGGLSWNTTNNALTVECWFRISIPSGQAISQNMTLLVDRKTGGDSDPYAYLILFNISSGSIGFQTSDGTHLDNYPLITRPFLDRWYHVAVKRSGNRLTALADGREIILNETDKRELTGGVLHDEGGC
jgi:hypothetical protein